MQKETGFCPNREAHGLDWPGFWFIVYLVAKSISYIHHYKSIDSVRFRGFMTWISVILLVIIFVHKEKALEQLCERS